MSQSASIHANNTSFPEEKKRKIRSPIRAIFVSRIERPPPVLPNRNPGWRVPTARPRKDRGGHSRFKCMEARWGFSPALPFIMWGVWGRGGVVGFYVRFVFGGCVARRGFEGRAWGVGGVVCGEELRWE